MPVSIRNAVAADRAFVLTLASRLVDGFDAPAHRTKAELIEGDRRALEIWFDDPSKDGEAMLIAELDGRPAGVAYLVTLIDYFNERPHAHLSVLAVDKPAEGKGIGSALLAACEQWARDRGSDRLTLSALVTNARARALYERKGLWRRIHPIRPALVECALCARAFSLWHSWHSWHPWHRQVPSKTRALTS